MQTNKSDSNPFFKCLKKIDKNDKKKVFCNSKDLTGYLFKKDYF